MGVRRLGAIAVNCMFYPEIGTKDRLDGNLPQTTAQRPGA